MDGKKIDRLFMIDGIESRSRVNERKVKGKIVQETAPKLPSYETR
jgi:hypothetical protein